MAEGQLLSHLPGLLLSDLFTISSCPVSKLKQRPLHPATPDLDDVLSTRVPLRKTHSRNGYRGLVAMLAGGPHRVISDTDTQAWTDLLFLPKLVLRQEPGGDTTENASQTT